MHRCDVVICSSALSRLDQCPASGCFVTHRKNQPTMTTSQEFGIVVHRYLEIAGSDGSESAQKYLASLPGESSAARTCSQIQVASIPRGETEVPYAHNPETMESRRLNPKNGTREVDLTTEQYGRADLIVTYPSSPLKAPIVIDYKCGAVVARTTRENTQLWGLASSLMAETGAKEIDTAIVRISSSGNMVWQVDRVSADFLRRYCTAAREIHLRVLEERASIDAGKSPRFVRGPACDRCKLHRVCPTMQQKGCTMRSIWRTMLDATL